jgi:hypothetical protein
MNYKKLVVNVETGEQYERDMTPDEIAATNYRLERAEADRLAAEEKAAAKLALLQKLNINEEEARLLLG